MRNSRTLQNRGPLAYILCEISMNELVKISEQQVFEIKTIQSVFTISSKESNSKLDIVGISVIPQFFEIKPNEIRKSIINKNQCVGGVQDIDKFTKKGTYFLNIKDYSEEEIRYFSNIISNELLTEIWTLLISPDDIGLKISLKENKIKEFVLEHNDNLFHNETEFNSFCKEYGLSIDSFIVPANFSKLDMKLREISARMELEQFFARRYLFLSELIDKLENRLEEYILNGNFINSDRKSIIDTWINKMNKRILYLKEFTDYHKLYNISPENKIEIRDSENINIINGNTTNSKIVQFGKNSSGTKLAIKIALWTLIVAIIALIVQLIIDWDSVF